MENSSTWYLQHCFLWNFLFSVSIMVMLSSTCCFHLSWFSCGFCNLGLTHRVLLLMLISSLSLCFLLPVSLHTYFHIQGYPLLFVRSRKLCYDILHSKPIVILKHDVSTQKHILTYSEMSMIGINYTPQ